MPMTNASITPPDRDLHARPHQPAEHHGLPTRVLLRLLPRRDGLQRRRARRPDRRGAALHRLRRQRNALRSGPRARAPAEQHRELLHSDFVIWYHHQQNTWYPPKGVFLPFSKLHSISAVANLFAYNNITISYYSNILLYNV